MALDIPLPRQILTHAHWTLGRQKMSKSLGNVVNPFFALERFGVDAVRYYLAHDGGIQDDADYDNSYIIDKYERGLKGGLGNLTSRVMRGKDWNVREAVRLGTSQPGHHSHEVTERHQQLLQALPGLVDCEMKLLNLGAALKRIMNTVHKVRVLIY